MASRAIDLAGQVAWVTGAARGIGRAIAVALAECGAKVVLAGRTAESLDATRGEIAAAGGPEPLVYGYDVADGAATREAFSAFLKTGNRLDVMVCNAGIMENGLLGMIRETDIGRTFDTNVSSVILHIQFASRLMTRRKAGSIITMSSIVGRSGAEGQTVYAASKAAILGATMAAAKELGPAGIRVNAIAPGFIETDLVADFDAVRREQTISRIRLGRPGKPRDVAQVAVFLASDLSGYVTGQVLGVDGGMVS